jgi:hypothetical protein
VIVAVANKPESNKEITAALIKAGLQVDEPKIENAFTTGYNIATFKSKTSPFTVDIIILEEKLDKNSGRIDSVEKHFSSHQKV